MRACVSKHVYTRMRTHSSRKHPYAHAHTQGQLLASPASVHIIVSSIQVLTSNPLVESWAHFPAAKRRLLELLLRARPHNLILLSGDVHFAELSGNPPIELTSSGMTHTCGTTFWARACAPLIRAFNRHRRHPSSYLSGSGRGSAGDSREGRGGGGAGAWEGSGEGFYTGYNFGLVEIDHSSSADVLPTVWASVLDVNGSEVCLCVGLFPSLRGWVCVVV
jgi:hypothetical protein